MPYGLAHVPFDPLASHPNRALMARRLLFVFLDGVGLGPASDANPFSSGHRRALQTLSGEQAWTASLTAVNTPDHLVRSIDATLGVDGLPQSGTGQATLLTGENCASLVGRHFGPFPHSSTHDVLARRNVFHRVNALELNCDAPSAFANAYPPQFFDVAQRRGRWTVTTRCCIEAGVEVRNLEALRARRAVTADLTGQAWRDRLGLDVPTCTENDAGARLVDVHRGHAFTLFEYFLTDKLGHGRLDTSPDALLDALNSFFGGVLATMNFDEEALLVTSDHGNLEDLDRKTHTRHPVPLFVLGWAAPYFHDVTDLTGITPAIVDALRHA